MDFLAQSCFHTRRRIHLCFHNSFLLNFCLNWRRTVMIESFLIPDEKLVLVLGSVNTLFNSCFFELYSNETHHPGFHVTICREARNFVLSNNSCAAFYIFLAFLARHGLLHLRHIISSSENYSSIPEGELSLNRATDSRQWFISHFCFLYSRLFIIFCFKIHFN